MDQSTWKILMVDDDNDDYVLIRQMLSEAKRGKYILEWAQSYEDGLKLIKENDYDVILMDYDLGPRNGLGLTRKAIESGCQAPIILFTGRGSYQVDIEAMQAGATLYLTKGETSAFMLERSIRYAIEHKQVERKLVESEARYRAILDTLPVGIGIFDTDGRLIETNPFGIHILRKGGQENLEDVSLLEENKLPASENLTLSDIGIPDVSNEKSIFCQQTVIKNSEGRTIPILASASPIIDSKGNLMGTVMTWVDISDRLRLEEELKASEKKNRDIVRYAPAGIYEVDFRQKRFITVNEAMSEFSGYSREELLRMDPFDILDEEGKLLFQKRIKRWLAGEEPEKNVEYRVRAKDGHTIYAVLNTAFTKDAEGRPLGATVIAFDISERRQAEEALRKSQKNLSRLVDTSYEGIWSVDQNGETTFVNQRAAEILGYTVDEIRGRNCFEFLMAGDVEAGRNTLALIAQGQSGRVEAHARYKDGSEAWLLVSFSPILDEHGEFQGALAMFTDITERKRMERSLEIYTEQLKRSNQDLENFAFMASHDLQEPLRKIEAFSRQLIHLGSSNLSEIEKDYLDRMGKSVVRMRTMVDDLLTLSRVSSRGLSFVQVDLNQSAQAALEDLEARIRQTRGKVEVSPLPVIEADQLQMHQLFQNLIGNALKFHRPEIPPVVKVTSKNLPDNRVEICVQDNGIGFDMSQVPSLFQPFQRLRGRSEYEGTGIGLSTCSKIAERHGGSITAESKPGEGAKFIVTLPVVQIADVS